MNPCLQEGDWRAYLDGELPAEELARAGEHLERCETCRGVHRALASRAAMVSGLMMNLETPPVAMPRPAAARSTRKWVVAGLAAAALVAAALVLAPSRVQTVEAPEIAPRVADVRPPEKAPVGQDVAPVAPKPVEIKAEPVHRLPRGRAVPARAQSAQYFLALDEEPIETGTVMRVTLANGIEADVIVDGDGRPRAIRAAHKY